MVGKIVIFLLWLLVRACPLERESAPGARAACRMIDRFRPARAIEVLEVRSTAALTEEESFTSVNSSRSPPVAFLNTGLGPAPSNERVGNHLWWIDSAQRPIDSATTPSSSLKAVDT